MSFFSTIYNLLPSAPYYTQSAQEPIQSIQRSAPHSKEYYEREYNNINSLKYEPRFKYLVLEGGGVKGIAIIGALEPLYKSREIYSIQYMTGTSVGALICGLVACRASLDILHDFVISTDFKKFRDSSWNPLKNIQRFLWKYGWYSGDELYEIYGQLLAKVVNSTQKDIRPEKAIQKPEDITFKQIYHGFGVKLIVPITLVYKYGCRTEYCSVDNFPNMPIRLACRYSAGFPFYFEAEPFLGTVVSDGGILNNYPINVFADYPDFYEKAIGIRLVSDHASAALKHSAHPSTLGGPPANIEEFTCSIIGAMHDQAQLIYIDEKDRDITIKVDTGFVSSMDLSLSSDDKKLLYNNGKEASAKHLKARKINENFKSFGIIAEKPKNILADIDLTKSAEILDMEILAQAAQMSKSIDIMPNSKREKSPSIFEISNESFLLNRAETPVKNSIKNSTSDDGIIYN